MFRITSRMTAWKRLLTPGIQMPTYILFYATHRCDARCKHCFFWRNLNQNSQNELTVSEIAALARSIGPVLQVTLTGGSPELRSDLPEIARHFSEKCQPLNITMCMNGYHSDRILACVEQTLGECKRQTLTVAISLDGIGEEHDLIRGMPGLFKRIIVTFSRLAALKSAEPRLNLVCGICISELNSHTAQNTAAWAWKNLPIDLLKPILVRGSPRESQTLGRNSVEVYRQLVSAEEFVVRRAAARVGSLFGVAVNAKEIAQRRLISHLCEGGQISFPCSAARQTAVIHADGMVAGCELRDEKLGNLRDHSMELMPVWYGKHAREFRARIHNEKCTCYHHCFLAPGVFKSLYFWRTFGGLLYRTRKKRWVAT